VAKWPAPVAFLKRHWPRINDAVWRLLKAGPDGEAAVDRDMLDDLHQEMWAEATRRVASYDPAHPKKAKLETHVLWGFVKVASAWVGKAVRGFTETGCGAVWSLSFEVAENVRLADVVFRDDEDVMATDDGRPFGLFQGGVESLDGRRKRVLEMRYLDDRPFEEIAAAVGVTRKRARQLEKSARTAVAEAVPVDKPRWVREFDRRQAAGLCQACDRKRFDKRLLCRGCHRARKAGGDVGRPTTAKLAGVA